MTIIINIKNYTPTEYFLSQIFYFFTQFNRVISNYCSIDISLADFLGIFIQISEIKPMLTIEKTTFSKFLENTIYELPEYMIDTSKASTKYRSVTTLNGIPFDIAKSAVQKYIRRSITHKAQFISSDIFLLHWKKDSKAILTNFYNRLRIIFFEDIGLASPYLIYMLDEVIDELSSHKFNTLSSKLVYVVESMAMNLHSRYYSHVKKHYSFYTESLEFSSCQFKYNLGKDENVRLIVDSLIHCLEVKSDSVMYWVLKLMDPELKFNQKRYNSTRWGFLVFDIAFKGKFITDKRSFDICLKWYKILKNKEEFLPVIHVLYLWVKNDSAIWIKPQRKLKYVENNTCLYKSYRNSLFNNPLEINENYVIDKHTNKGRRKFGRNSADFSLEGSLVSYDLNIDSEYYEEYIKLYLEKAVDSNIFSEKDEFIFKIRTQLNTGISKPDVYFATDKLGNNVVVKGPYRNLKSALIPFNISNMAKLFEGVNTYDINLRILKSDMWNKVPLGYRNSIKFNSRQFFIVMEDILNKDEYPKILKSSKLWKSEPILDYEKLFNDNPKMGYGYPSKMSEKACYSFVIQILFRLIFRIGDLSYRNFIRIDDKLYNIDLEGLEVGDVIKFSKAELSVLEKCYIKNKTNISCLMNVWLSPGNSTIDKWDIIRLTMPKINIEDVKDRIRNIKITSPF